MALLLFFILFFRVLRHCDEPKAPGLQVVYNFVCSEYPFALVFLYRNIYGGIKRWAAAVGLWQSVGCFSALRWNVEQIDMYEMGWSPFENVTVIQP